MTCLLKGAKVSFMGGGVGGYCDWEHGHQTDCAIICRRVEAFVLFFTWVLEFSLSCSFWMYCNNKNVCMIFRENAINIKLQKKAHSSFLPCVLSSCVSASGWYFSLPQCTPARSAGDFTTNWSSRRPLLGPSSRSLNLASEWFFVYCFSKRGPWSRLSQVPLHAPQCLIVSAK